MFLMACKGGLGHQGLSLADTEDRRALHKLITERGRLDEPGSCTCADPVPPRDGEVPGRGKYGDSYLVPSAKSRSRPRT